MEDLLGGAGAREVQTASTTAMACLTGGTLCFTTCSGEARRAACCRDGFAQLHLSGLSLESCLTIDRRALGSMLSLCLTFSMARAGFWLV